MPQLVDNLLAYRILTMLIKPFNETAAYRLGIIDAEGNNLIPSKNFTKPEQDSAYTYLHRLTFNLKKILNRLPGGESKTKNLVAALFLVKESYARWTTQINEDRLVRVSEMLQEGVLFVEEQTVVDRFVEEIANVTGPGVSTDEPVIRKGYKPKIARHRIQPPNNVVEEF